MLEVTSEEHGFCLRMFPTGGVEVNDLRLVSKTLPVSTAGAASGTDVDAVDSMAMIRRLSAAFPQLAEIDLSEVPLEYDITFGAVDFSMTRTGIARQSDGEAANECKLGEVWTSAKRHASHIEWVAHTFAS